MLARSIFNALLLVLVLFPPTPRAATLANRNATQTAINLYQYLAALPDRSSKRVSSGQETGNANPTYNIYSAAQGYPLYVTNLKNATGSLVGLAGFDYSSDPTPSYRFPQITDAGVLEIVNSSAINHWRQGGIVTVMFGANNPWTGGGGSDTNRTGHRLSDAITPGTAAYSNWMAQLDAVATALQQLQDAGVVVLWRPLHEMNGAWFWWGSAANPQDYKDLWQHMFNYFTNVRQLNNLIWVYAASSGVTSAQNSVNSYYPGADFVDIVGIDGYKDTIDSAIIAAYNALLVNGKPFALAEYGPASPPAGSLSTAGTFDFSTLITGIRNNLPKTCYFMAWADCPTCNPKVHWSMVSNLNASTLLSDPWVVNAGDLPDFAALAPLHSVAIALSPGWNLIGNSASATIDVADQFGDAAKVASVWKWVSRGTSAAVSYPTWAYYSPAQGDRGQAYASSRGYEALTTINGGDGLWVNATAAFTAQLPAATLLESSFFQTLGSGWNLISTGTTQTPAAFNANLSPIQPAAGLVPINMRSLWAWDAAQAKWYFYSPALDAQGGNALADYIASQGYLNFTTANKTLGSGVGFWLYKP